MATIRSSIVVQDMASSVFAKINSSLNRTNRGFRNLNNEMSVAPTNAINNAERLNSSAQQTQKTYESELQVLRQVEAEANRIVAAEGTQTARAQDIIASVQAQRELVSDLKQKYEQLNNTVNNSANASNNYTNTLRNNIGQVNSSINSSNVSSNRLLSTIRNIFTTANRKVQLTSKQDANNILQAELAYQAELQVLKQVEAEARKIIAAEGSQTAKAQDIIESVREQRVLVENLKTNYDNVANSIRNNRDNQEQFNNSINTANSNSNKLLNTIKNIAMTIGGIAAIKNLVNLSDTTTSNRSRLELIVDDNGSVADLENKIFAMADRTRSDFLDTTSVVSKLGILARDSFKNTDEIIAFTELMNKNFAISGASIQEQTSAMYQLTQAMAAGKLQGDEFRSIMENAPLLAEAIANYTGKSKGELKELSSEGKITADVIKNAMFSSADQINARYNKMPMTWAQIWNKMKNVAVKALDPVLTKINELANNEQVQQMFTMFIDGASLAAQAVLALIEGISWLVSVLEPVAPIILGIVAAYVAFNIISAITSGILTVMSVVQGIQSAASMLQAGATIGATAAQWGLNTALLACPITWIVILIIALIAVLTYLWFTNDKVAYGILYTWDALVVGLQVCGLGIQGIWYGLQLAAMYLWLGIQTVVLGLMAAWYGFQTGVEAVCLGVLAIFQGLYNGIVSIVNGIISVLNKIPGVNIDYAETAHFADDFATNMQENIIDRNQKLQDMASQMDGTIEQINSMKADFASKLNAGATAVQNSAIDRNNTREDRVAHRNDWANGAGDAIKSALSNFSLDPSNFGGETLGNIAGDTKDIAKNTADITDEDLKYLIDIAERDTINRFTTVPLSINVTNNNSINGEQDIDGIVDQVTDKLTSRLQEELEYVSEGIHE